MADGFHTKDNVWQVISNLLSVLGKKKYNKENYKHKIEKIYFMKTHI